MPPGVLTPKEEKDLRRRHPNLNSPEELARLISDLARVRPASRIEARDSDDGKDFQIEFAHGKLVKEVRIKLVTRSFESLLNQLAEKYNDQPDSPMLRERLQGDVKEFLAAKGFPSALITVRASDMGSQGVNLAVDIDENYPCLIGTIRHEGDTSLPSAFTLRSGDVCNLEAIREAENELEEHYRDEGYRLASVDVSPLIYNDNRSRADLNLSIAKGKRIQYEILVTDEDFNLRELFAEDVIEAGDAASVDPSAMPNEIRKRYQNLGFADVEVEKPEVKRDGNESFTYLFRVQLGPRYLISNIKFEGVTQYDEEEALEIMEMKSLWRDTSVLNPELLNAGIDSLRSRYLADGFWDAKIRYPNIGKDKISKFASVTVRVQEGKRRLLNGITLSGNRGLSEPDIVRLLELKKGDPIDQSLLVKFEEDLKQLYINRGYLYANCQLQLVSKPQKKEVLVDLRVQIDEFKPVTIGTLSIKGLQHTKEEVVTRELRFESGARYDAEAIAATRRALLRLGIFRSVQIVPTDASAVTSRVENLDITIDIVEAEAGSVSFGPGYSWPEGMHYNGEISYNNLLGSAKRVALRGGISEQRQQAAISNKTLLGRKVSTSYLHPYLYGLPIDATTTLLHRASIAEQNDALWELFYSGEIDLQHRLRRFIEDATVSVYYGQVYNREEGVDEDKLYLISTGDARIGYTGARFNIDRRNDIAWPSKGFTFDSEFEMARFPLGGNIRYDKWEFFYTHYIGVGPASTFVLGLSLGSYRNIAWAGDFPNILPVSERFTAGGIGTVRGFRRGALGPYIRHPSLDDSGLEEAGSFEEKVTGGSQKTLMKFEYRYRFMEAFAISAFIDSGTVFLSNAEVNEFGRAFDRIHAERLPDDTEDAGKASIEENVDYSHKTLVTNPKAIFDHHYTAIGPAFSFLSAIGSITGACGFPVHIAKTERCRADESFCISRGDEGNRWYASYSCGLNVGARF